VRILVIERDPLEARQIARALEAESFTVDTACNGEDGFHLGSTKVYRAIVLDPTLPRLGGVSMLRNWRRDRVDTPVLILSERTGCQDRVAGLNTGSDDYLGKPFWLEKLVARINALIRRASGSGSPTSQIGAITHHPQTQRVTLNGCAVPLTAHEYKVFATLAPGPDVVHPRRELEEIVYGIHDERDSNTIEVFLARLRRKLGPTAFETARGSGHRLGTR